MTNIQANAFENAWGKVWFEDNMVFCIYKSVEIDLERAKACVAMRLEAAQSEDYPTFIDMSHVKSTSREAREYFASEEGVKSIKAGALIVNSKLSKIIGNFFLNINKPSTPAKLFNNREDAVRWLQQYT